MNASFVSKDFINSSIKKGLPPLSLNIYSVSSEGGIPSIINESIRATSAVFRGSISVFLYRPSRAINCNTF
ncbi:hypothetical protein ES705_31990 [subsurface metagenome]